MRASSWSSSLVCLQDSIKSETELLDYYTRRWSSLLLHPIIIVE